MLSFVFMSHIFVEWITTNSIGLFRFDWLYCTHCLQRRVWNKTENIKVISLSRYHFCALAILTIVWIFMVIFVSNSINRCVNKIFDVSSSSIIENRYIFFLLIISPDWLHTSTWSWLIQRKWYVDSCFNEKSIFLWYK